MTSPESSAKAETLRYIRQQIEDLSQQQAELMKTASVRSLTPVEVSEFYDRCQQIAQLVKQLG